MKKTSVVAVAVAAVLVVMLSGFAGLQRHRESTGLGAKGAQPGARAANAGVFHGKVGRERDLVDHLLQGDSEEESEASSRAGKRDLLDDLLENPG